MDSPTKAGRMWRLGSLLVYV